jgi:hypothetical protein
MTLFSTSFVVAPHCTAGMPFAMGIPAGGTLKLTSYCPRDSYGERIRQLAEKSPEGIPLGEMGVSNAKASLSN